MKFFIDTANLDEIRQAAALGILDGVTTNPSLMANEEGNFQDILLEICSVVDGPVNGEVVSTDFHGMVSEGEKLAALHPNIVVKIPIIKEGLMAIKELSRQGIRTNTTLIFSSSWSDRSGEMILRSSPCASDFTTRFPAA